MKRRRILILNQNGIGDIIMRFPACRWLCSQPKYDAWMLVKGETEAELCTNERLGSQIITLNRSSTIQLIKKVVMLRLLHIDTVIGWWGFSRRKVAFFTRVIGAKNFICPEFNEQDQYDRNTSHKYQKNLSVVSHFLGKPIPEDRKNDYFLDNIENNYFNQVIGHRRYIVIFPGSGEKEKFKRWPCKEWVNFCKLFFTIHPTFHIIIAGSSSESNLAEGIINNINIQASKINNLCGKASMRQVAGLCKNAKFVIGGDNGGLHIAKASGARVVAIMGPTNSSLTGPINPTLIIDQKLPGTPWYSRKLLRHKKNNIPDVSMQIPAKKVLDDLISKYIF